MVTAQFTVTNEEPMESVSLMLSYDKDVMTYMSGSGGDNFDVTGGNGSVQMTSSPEILINNSLKIMITTRISMSG